MSIEAEYWTLGKNPRKLDSKPVEPGTVIEDKKVGSTPEGVYIQTLRYEVGRAIVHVEDWVKYHGKEPTVRTITIAHEEINNHGLSFEAGGLFRRKVGVLRFRGSSEQKPT